MFVVLEMSYQYQVVGLAQAIYRRCIAESYRGYAPQESSRVVDLFDVGD